MQALIFKAPRPAEPLSETNLFTATAYDGVRFRSYSLTLAESLEWQALNGRAADAPADLIRMQGSVPGADISLENPMVRYTYEVPTNWAALAKWIDTNINKPALLGWQQDDAQIPDTLEG